MCPRCLRNPKEARNPLAVFRHSADVADKSAAGSLPNAISRRTLSALSLVRAQILKVILTPPSILF